jgi:hypothetical protein
MEYKCLVSIGGTALGGELPVRLSLSTFTTPHIGMLVRYTQSFRHPTLDKQTRLAIRTRARLPARLHFCSHSL